MIATHGYAAAQTGAPLMPFAFERRAPGPYDVVIDILYCGICHSDISYVDNIWGNSLYPLVPGHEIVGRVTAIGVNVTKFRPGDIAAIGCIIDSCRKCEPCTHDLENMCVEGATLTYSDHECDGGAPTFGGYSSVYVADEAYVVKIPAGMDPACAAPLLCAGITTYSPLRHWNVGPGVRVGIAGIGGLGHVAIKLAHAMGAHVTVFTTSSRKTEDALALGAHDVVLSTDADQMAEQAGRLDFILDTIAVMHDVAPYLAALRRDGTLCLVGAPAEPFSVGGFSLIMGRKSFAGSVIGGIAETQEMLDFCADRDIAADIELIAIQDTARAYERLHRGDVRYRFVIDMATLAL